MIDVIVELFKLMKEVEWEDFVNEKLKSCKYYFDFILEWIKKGELWFKYFFFVYN